MTEAQWLACTDPGPMLEFLGGKASDRKLRLFAAACCRRVEFLLRDWGAREALAVVERLADGLATDEERSDARGAAQQATQSQAHPMALRAASAVYWAAARSAMEAARNARQQAIDSVYWLEGDSAGSDYTSVRWRVEAGQVELLRDIIGNPFRPIASPAPWLSWNDGTIAALAQAIYDERAFDRLPILADALEDAGCDNADLLAHCREPGEHVRGCWVIDLLLGKE